MSKNFAHLDVELIASFASHPYSTHRRSIQTDSTEILTHTIHEWYYLQNLSPRNFTDAIVNVRICYFEDDTSKESRATHFSLPLAGELSNLEPLSVEAVLYNLEVFKENTGMLGDLD